MRLLVSVLISSLVVALYWIGGGEFERGIGLAAACVWSLGAFVMAYSCPAWQDRA